TLAGIWLPLGTRIALDVSPRITRKGLIIPDLRYLVGDCQLAHYREILYNDIYNWDNEPSTNTLEVHIHNLRDKVGKARIRTVRGFGYMLVANEEN
ncbi:winged helix-turn-helix domain-containing protein, partial [Escherichia coli]